MHEKKNMQRSCIDMFFAGIARITVSVLEQESGSKTLVSLKNVTAERYWDMRWQREWQTKYHDPLTVIFVAMLASFFLFIIHLVIRSEIVRCGLGVFRTRHDVRQQWVIPTDYHQERGGRGG